MSSLNGTGLPAGTVNQPSFPDPNLPATQGNDGTAATQNADQPQQTSGPIAGNTSGLLQNFILPRTTLDALGLLRPTNQGDGEILISQVTLIAEELAGESEDERSRAGGAVAATQTLIVQAFRDRIISLEEANRIAQSIVDANAERIGALNEQITPLENELTGLEGQRTAINQQLATLNASNPITPAIAQQIQQLSEQLSGSNSRISEITTELGELRAERDPLIAENAVLEGEIEVREAQISNQNALVALIVLLFAAIRSALDGSDDAIEEAQEFIQNELGEQNLEELLPNLQEIFEVDLEDAEIQELIDETAVSDVELQKALVVSFGLAGSFFEALGLFLQLADLVELDLDTVARANNESQRLQIAL